MPNMTTRFTRVEGACENSTLAIVGLFDCDEKQDEDRIMEAPHPNLKRYTLVFGLKKLGDVNLICQQKAAEIS